MTSRSRAAVSVGFCLGIAMLLGTLSLLVFTIEGTAPHFRRGSWWVPADIGLGMLALAAIPYRRRWPIPLMLATAALAAVTASASGAATVVAVSVVAGAVCARHWRVVFLTGVITLVSVMSFALIHVPRDDRLQPYVEGATSTAVLVMIGWVLGEWRIDRRAAWANAWRMVVSALLGLALWGILLAEGTNRGFQDGDVWVVLDPLVGLVAVVLLPLRRRWPLAILAVTSLIAAVSAFATPASLLVLVSLATRRRWRENAAGSLIALLSGTGFGLLHPATADNQLSDAILNLVLVGFSVALGLFIGARRELVANLREQVATAKREQEARVAQARTHERTRIAREMHDVLAHRISLVAMHAGALAYRENLPPEQVRNTAELLHSSSHQALTELREVLGVLRDTDGGSGDAPEPPQPTLCELDDLVASAREGGQRVVLDHTLDLSALPNSLSRNAFRIVQESLTNARKHARDQMVTIRLTGRPGDRLVLEVRNPPANGTAAVPAAPGAGLGLVGLRERAHLSGGTLDAGSDRAGDFVVRATLAWNQSEEREETA